MSIDGGFWLFLVIFGYFFHHHTRKQVGQFLLSSGFCDTDEESEEKCQALARSLQKVDFLFYTVFGLLVLDATVSYFPVMCCVHW